MYVCAWYVYNILPPLLLPCEVPGRLYLLHIYRRAPSMCRTDELYSRERESYVYPRAGLSFFAVVWPVPTTKHDETNTKYIL